MGERIRRKVALMDRKLVLVVIDGLRADALESVLGSIAKKWKEKTTYCKQAKSVKPSLTLPALTSMFHGVTPDRHSIFINEWTPQVRPIVGLIEQLDDFDKTCAVFATSEETREICRPNHLVENLCFNAYKKDGADEQAIAAAKDSIENYAPDFALVHLKSVDLAGHRYGFESEQYHQAIEKTVAMVDEFLLSVSKREVYHWILTSDHGGSGRNHGADTPENLFVPIYFYGEAFEKKKELSECSITDIAKTVAGVLGVPFVRDWEGENRAVK